MKKVFFVLMMMTGVLLFTSCNQRSNNATVEEVTTVDRVRVDVPDNIVTDSVTDASGNKLYLTYNNTRGVVDIVFNGDKLTLTQDTTASGIRFSNNQYVYEEWQGNATLKKDGTIVFDNQR